MKVEIGRARIFAIDWKIGRDFMQKEGFIVGMKAFVRTIIKSLRAVSRLVSCFPIAVDGNEQSSGKSLLTGRP
jgi:hypothetical protein